MEKIVKMVAAKAGISESQAQTAVTTVAGYLKDKMPPALASQVDKYLQGGDTSNDAGDIAGKMSGMFGKK